jgi:hypothetical protein
LAVRSSIPENDAVATVRDVIVRYGEEEYPPVMGLVARYRRRNFFIPVSDVAEINSKRGKDAFDYS